MSPPQICEGTAEEIFSQPHKNYGGQKLRVSVEALTEATDEAVQSIDASEDLKPIPNHPLARLAGMFRDSAFFDDVVESIRIREEEESKKYEHDQRVNFIHSNNSLRFRKIAQNGPRFARRSGGRFLF